MQTRHLCLIVVIVFVFRKLSGQELGAGIRRASGVCLAELSCGGGFNLGLKSDYKCRLVAALKYVIKGKVLMFFYYEMGVRV